MKSICITALTLAVGVFGAALAPAGTQLQAEEQAEKRQIGNLSTVLPDLLHTIKSQTGIIDGILDGITGPISGDKAKEVARDIGVHFHNLTGALHSARDLLSSLGNETLVDENGDPCDLMCIVDKTKGIVRHGGKTSGKAVLKLGLHALGKTISPFFQALSAFVLILNTIVGGALAAIATLVNGIGLAIAAGLAYLGHLVSEKEKMRAGGPGGNITHSIGHLIREVVGVKLAQLDL